MDVAEYAKAQAAITAEALEAVYEVLRLFRRRRTRAGWTSLLGVLYNIIAAARERAARLAREFYDSQRELHHPNLPRHDVYLGIYRPEWFAEDMFPARSEFLKTGSSRYAFDLIAARAAKAVENGGRRQILRAVEEDRVIKGWARVATGRETCGFCMMLVSRGPVYRSAEGAGLDLDDTSAEDLWNQGDHAAMNAMMRKFHPNCDCKVVPVFDRANWPGRDAYRRAEAVWRRVTKGYTGRDAMNAFRRAIENGEVDVDEMSIAA